MVSSILKHCKNGVIYIFTLPVLIVILSVFAVVGIIEFIFLGTKAIIYFFSGRNLFGEFPEDIEARKIIESYDNPVTTIELKKEEGPVVEESNVPIFTTNIEDTTYTTNGVEITSFDSNEEDNSL